MHPTIRTASAVAPQEVHPLSFHPKIRAVLKQGADKMWGVKDLMELLGLEERAVQQMLAENILANTTFPTRRVTRKPRRQVRTGSLLLYLVKNSTEMSEADVLGSLGVILDQVPSSTLQQLVAHLQKKLIRRASQPVLVVSAEGSSSAAVQTDLFS